MGKINTVSSTLRANKEMLWAAISLAFLAISPMAYQVATIVLVAVYSVNAFGVYTLEEQVDKVLKTFCFQILYIMVAFLCTTIVYKLTGVDISPFPELFTVAK